MTDFIKVLPANTAALLLKLSEQKVIEPFYLTGGTALASMLGHRASEDLDFFNEHEFDPLVVQHEIKHLGVLKNVELAPETLNLFLDGVKLQFLHYPYRLLEPVHIWNGVKISSELDVACTKLLTISMRGSKKDFIDLFFLLRDYALPTLFEKLSQKYEGTHYNQAHILKSLVYFEDADRQPMPRMERPVNWIDIKQALVRAVREFDVVRSEGQ